MKVTLQSWCRTFVTPQDFEDFQGWMFSLKTPDFPAENAVGKVCCKYVKWKIEYIGVRVTGDRDERHGILDPNPIPWSGYLILILILDPWSLILILDHDRLRGGRKRKKKRRRRSVPRSHQWPIKQFDDHERSQSLHIHREVILVLWQCGNQKLKSFQIVLRWSGFRLWEVERECWTGVQLICKKIYNHLDGFEYSELLLGIVQAMYSWRID